MNKKFGIIFSLIILFFGSLVLAAETDPLLLTPKVTTKVTASITSFTPTVGGAGDTVTINGENLTGINGVLFGTIPVADLDVHPVSINKMTVKVPPGVVDGKITVKTEKNGDAVSNDNFTTVKILALSYSDVTATSVKFSVSGSLSKGDYLFYVYDENTYPDGAPAVPVQSSTNPIDNASSISATISNLTPSHDYVGVIDKGGTGWGTQNAPEAVHFTTLSDSTAMNNITPSTPATPVPAKATSIYTGIVPECNTGEIDKVTGQYKNACGFDKVMELINSIIKFLLFDIATPLVALILMYTGYLFITAGGNSGQVEKVRHILFSAVVGYIIALAAWLIVNTIVSSLNIDPTINTFLDKSSLTK